MTHGDSELTPEVYYGADPSDGQVALEILGRPVQQRPYIDVGRVKEGLTVGPDEVLVIVCHGRDRWELEAVRDRMRDSGLRPEQILIFGGDVTIGKAPADQIRLITTGGDPREQPRS